MKGQTAIHLPVALAAIFTANASLAQSSSPWYAELSLGQAEIQAEGSPAVNLPVMAILGGSSCLGRPDLCHMSPAVAGVEPEGDVAVKLGLGREFGDHFTVDVAYQQFKDFESNDQGFRFARHVSQSLRGINLNAGAQLPITERISVFAKAGLMAYDSEKRDTFDLSANSWYFRPFDPAAAGLDPADVSADADRVVVDYEDSGTAVNFSVGAAYAFTSNIDLKLEYQHIPDIADIEVDLYSLSVVLHF